MSLFVELLRSKWRMFQGSEVSQERSTREERMSIYQYPARRGVLILDLMCGFMVTTLLFWLVSPASVALRLTLFRDTTKEHLTELITWLMGAPAGLKVNREYTNFLGKLFLYHIDIWMNYLKILEPYLPILIQVTFISGFGGLSVMISISHDLLTLLTIHLYCYYIYASKLYYFQVFGVTSLARLFRGKKYNVLRKRVDTLVSDIDELALGTILFTVLLFLLPTIMPYYLVFVIAWLIIYHIQWLMVAAVQILDINGIAGALLAIAIKSGFFKGKSSMDIQWLSDTESKFLSVTGKRSYADNVYPVCVLSYELSKRQDNNELVRLSVPRYNLKGMVSKILWGNTISCPLYSDQCYNGE